MEESSFFEKWACVLGMALLSSVVGIVVYILAMLVISDGRVDYCYIKVQQTPNVELMAHVPWGSDLHTQVFPSIDAAVQAANLMNCKLGVK